MDVLMKKLIDHSILVNSDMIALYPKYGREEVISVYKTVKENSHCYAVENGIIGFVTENHLYVIPYITQAIEILEEKEFQKVIFHVPFSNGSCPKHDLKKWRELCNYARQNKALKFYKDCVKFADAHNIGSISDEALSKCLTIPDTGMLVTPSMFSKIYYPILRRKEIDTEVIENIGTYATRNGIVVFVYRDGSTRVSKCNKVIQELVEAGYKYNSNLIVPLSEENEEPFDYELYLKWEALTS